MIADLPPDPDALGIDASQLADVKVGDGTVRADVDLAVGDECDPLLDVATDVHVTDDQVDADTELGADAGT